MKHLLLLLVLTGTPAAHQLSQGRLSLPEGTIGWTDCRRGNRPDMVFLGPPLGILVGLLRAASRQGFPETRTQLGLERD